MEHLLVFTTTFPNFQSGDATPGFVYQLSKRLGEKGVKIVVLTPRTPGTKKYEEINNMKIYRYPYFFFSSWEKLNDGAILPNLKKNKLLFTQIPFLLLSGFFHLITVARKESITTIHAHWIIPQGLLAVVYKKLFRKNISILCTTHGGDIFGLKGKIGQFLKKYTLKNVDTLTVVSNAIKTECIKLGLKEKDKIKVLPMGVDETIFHPQNNNPSLKKELGITGEMLLFVGRIAEKKGITYLIDAIPQVITSFPEAKLVIIGNGPLEDKLKIQTVRLKLNKHIIFLGGIENKKLPEYYATADMFIGPSIIAKDGDSEGFGLVFVESILSGTITLGSNLYGITDIIKDGKTGYLLKPNDSKDISRKIIQGLQSSTIDTNKAREHIKNDFGRDIISEKYYNLL